MHEEKPYLIDTISYDEDIKNYRFVEIFSGVGSGKNFLAESFIKGNPKYNIPKKTVLIITSRKSKVQEVLSDKKIDIENRVIQDWSEYNHIYNDEEEYDRDNVRTIYDDDGLSYSLYQKSVICTNAFIEQYLKYIYNPADVTTHLWELFDIIIVDEVHSLVLDTSYQSAPFYVIDLMNEFLYRHRLADKDPATFRRPLCEQLILMTGTKDPIKVFNEPKNVTNVVDRMDVCKRVQPKNIYFINLKDAKAKIAEQLSQGERIVYFQNHTTLPSEFCKDTMIDSKLIVPSFSKQEKRTSLKKENESLYKRMEEVENYIRENKMLPDDVQMFLTTSRNKEGININDLDINNMYIESHLITDIEQMAGRVRNGVENLYVIVDAKGFSYTESEFEVLYTLDQISSGTRKEDGGAANMYLKELCAASGIDIFHNRDSSHKAFDNEQIEKFIKFIHEKYLYAKYSYIDNVFKFYKVRKHGMKYILGHLKIFNDAIYKPSDCLHEFGEWFPDSNIHPYYSVDMQAWDIFLRHIPSLDAEYSMEVKQELERDLQAKCYPELTNLNSMLNRFSNIKWRRKSGNKKSSSYNKVIFEDVL